MVEKLNDRFNNKKSYESKLTFEQEDSKIELKWRYQRMVIRDSLINNTVVSF